ncbi:proline iminopeptidase-family hydrolase [Planococcus sp. YIM B11945]|uniref:proline iminopeptidase-family hydrolase n=1 Tax=Planococcus sp. YIM B11945 TaxID=3435410 RepID=UPI003D7DB2AC
MTGKSKIIPLKNGFHVWTRKVGESPIKLLLLHGGPGCTHEYFEIFEDYLPPEGVEIYFYDQLGSYYSDQPDDPNLWDVDRFREEVEEVRTALGLDQFYLLGSSWGGMLGIEYALKYGEGIKGLIVSNMTASIESYVKHINELRNQLPQNLIDTMKSYEEKGDFHAPEYEEIVQEHLNEKHICRLDPWPDAVIRSFSHMSEQVYNTMQGPNEFVVTGTFKDWNRWESLKDITNPTLLIVGRHDSMSPDDIEEMGRRIPNSRVGICEDGSHLAMWDDPEAYFDYLITFIKDVEAGNFAENHSLKEV